MPACLVQRKLRVADPQAESEQRRLAVHCARLPVRNGRRRPIPGGNDMDLCGRQHDRQARLARKEAGPWKEDEPRISFRLVL